MKYVPDYSSRFRILKGGKISLVVSALVAGSTMTFASPTGGEVTSGSAAISQSGAITNIHQSTDKASINWQSFNIAGHETVNFIQPSASSVTLNRVVGTSSSLIQGAMNANGQVFLINPNGVLFANGSQVNVGGLVASTLNITDANFQAGNYVFEGNSQSSVLNMGAITTSEGGYVAMMGKTVANEGTIVATMGNVQMASGEKISLNLNGNSLVKLTIDQGTINALVENKGLIQADGGQVYLTTQALNTILDGMVNNSGIIEAQTLNDVTGEVILFAHGGTANIGGTIDATGGFVETSGKEVKISDEFTIKAKDWLIDPLNFTISSGTAAQTASGMGATTLSNALATTNVTIQTDNVNGSEDGDIFVNADISWLSTNFLMLNAYRDIHINANITSTNGVLGLVYGYGTEDGIIGGKTSSYNIASGKSINLHSGAYFNTLLGNDSANIVAYTVINDATSLQDMNDNKSGNYALGSNVDLDSVPWTTIGNASNKFTGKFDGLGNAISNLSINSINSNLGLFGFSDGATIQNLNINNFDITSSGGALGTLVGNALNTTISNINIDAQSSVTSTISGEARIGGLVGLISGGNISDIESFATVSATTGNRVGGIIGESINTGGAITISSIVANGNVTGQDRVGGLVGYANIGTQLSNSSFADFTVLGRSSVGGAVGYAVTDVIMDGLEVRNALITATDSTNNGIGYSDVGGLVGDLYNNSILKNSKARDVTVTGTGRSIGGAVGYMAGTSSLNQVYAIGTATMTGAGTQGAVGGLVGAANTTGTISNSYAEVDVAVPTGGNTAGTRLGVGSLIGQSNGATVTNSYAIGVVHGQTVANTAGLIGQATGTTVNNSYYNKTVNAGMSDEGAYGKTTAELQIKSTYENWDETIWSFGAGDTVEGYGVSRAYLTNVTREEDKPTSTTLFASGWGDTDGDGAYTITSAQQLQNINLVANDGYDFALSNNINLVGINWTPIGNLSTSFSGSFDGDNYTISGLTIERPNDNRVGLFGFVFKSWDEADIVTIKNLTLSNVDVTGNDNVGALVGEGQNIHIENITVSGSVSGDENVGGLIGSMIDADDTILNSSSSATVTGIEKVGGLAGYIRDSSVRNSFATGSVSGELQVGGLAGFARRTNITDSYATGSVFGEEDQVGGLVGVARDIEITNSYSTGNVTGNSYVGGLIGDTSNSSITKSFATGDVSSGGDYVGGLIGGLWNSTLSEVYATGDVTVQSGALNKQYYGGLVGVGTFDDFEKDFLLENLYATGNVKASGSYVGGLFGSIETGEGAAKSVTIKNGYATGTVEGDEFVNGVVGQVWNYDEDNSWEDVHFENVFWDVGSSKIGVAGDSNFGAIGKSTADMKKLATFSGWGTNIVADSSLSNVYPQFRWSTSGLGAGNSIWVIGGLAAVDSSSSTTQQQQTQQQVNNVITTIVNSTTVTPPITIQRSTTTQPTNTTTQIVMNGSDAGTFKVVGTTDGGEAVQTMTTEQLQQMNPGMNEIRVALGQDSFVELVNGGVNLPQGVSQEFYVVNNTTGTTNIKKAKKN